MKLAHLNVPGLPKVINEGLRYLNISEIKGPASNEVIMKWAKELGLEKVYTNDDIAWCGLFVAYVIQKTGREPVVNPLWARNWVKFGVVSPQPSLGDILVFARNGGGHVGFYIAEDNSAYHVLGGNQGNKVSIVRILKNRLLQARRPIYNSIPATAIPYVVSANGSLSVDEA